MKNLILVFVVLTAPVLLHAQLSEFSVDSASELLQMQCRQTMPDSRQIESEIRQSIVKELKDSVPEDRIIMGVEFKQQKPEVLYAFELLVSPKVILADQVKLMLRDPNTSNEDRETWQNLLPNLDFIQHEILKTSDGSLLPFKSSKASYDFKDKVPAGCHDVICATKAIFGVDRAMKMLLLYVNYNILASEYAGHQTLGTEYISAWTDKELNSLVTTFLQVPENMDLDFEGDGLSHIDRKLDVSLNTGYLIANATMMFGNNWSKEPDFMKEYIAFHELAHRLAELKEVNGGLPLLDKWSKVTGWAVNAPINLVSIYAKDSVKEDLAESISAYRYVPKKLLKISPARYSFIKEHIFDGKEFLTASDCEKWKWNGADNPAGASSVTRSAQ